MQSMLYAQESYVNATEGRLYGEGPVTETFTADRGELYRACQKEYGRCTGKVYIDSDEGPRAIGWVFQGRARYEDSDETYLREVWVTVHTSPPDKIIHYHYA